MMRILVIPDDEEYHPKKGLIDVSVPDEYAAGVVTSIRQALDLQARVFIASRVSAIRTERRKHDVKW